MVYDNRILDVENLISLMADDSPEALSAYVSEIEDLVRANILSRSTGFRVDAHGIISRNPREAVNCGRQLYFIQERDAISYGNIVIGESNYNIKEV